jgi:hypothetical protein
VQGCFLGFLCGGENWTRVNPPNTNHAPPSPNSAEAPTSNLLEMDKGTSNNCRSWQSRTSLG